MKPKFLFAAAMVALLAGSQGCVVGTDGTADDEPVAGTSEELVTANRNYVASVTGGVVIKKTVFVTSTIAAPAIRTGKVTFGPTPARCSTTNGVQTCRYTMTWKGVTIDNFSANGDTFSGVTLDTFAPVPVTVVNGKFTIPANTARFTVSGKSNGSFFMMNRWMDSPLTGTFAPNGAFTIAGTVTRYISGPIGTNVKVWANLSLSGAAVDTAPLCRNRGGGIFACDSGGQPSGSCQPTKVHRTVFQCNGSNKSPEEIIDLSSGYSNYTCSNRFAQHCIDDGSFDSYYSEWCDFSCQ